MARVYADQAAYEAYHGLQVGEAPANVTRLLSLASRVVDRLLIARVYDTDTDGYPTDPDHTQALSDATCAIAGASADTGALDSTSSSEEWDSVSIGSVSLSGRSKRSDTTSVDGVPVPAAATLLLDEVGTPWVGAR